MFIRAIAIIDALAFALGSGVSIALANGANQLVLKVQNNGLPFPDLGSKSTGMGLRIMRYRAKVIGATLDLQSQPGQGTQCLPVLLGRLSRNWMCFGTL